MREAPKSNRTREQHLYLNSLVPTPMERKLLQAARLPLCRLWNAMGQPEGALALCSFLSWPANLVFSQSMLVGHCLASDNGWKRSLLHTPETKSASALTQ